MVDRSLVIRFSLLVNEIQKASWKAQAEQEGISQGALIRNAVDAYVKTKVKKGE